MNDLLQGVKVVDLSTALPGPLAAGRLAELGAKVVKLEPPWGDLLQQIAPAWYEQINQSKTIWRLDLKTAGGQAALDRELADADLVILTMRPAALERLGLDPERLSNRFPRAGVVAIVGDSPPHAERSGHDLTYQAAAGLLQAPRMPRFLLADLMGTERAVQAALAVLFRREKTGEGSWEWVSLTRAAGDLRQVLDFGMTAPDQILGGGNPRYGYYRSADGWVTLAALEDRLWARFLDAVGSSDLLSLEARPLAGELERIFRTRSSHDWEVLAREHHLPLAAVSPPESSRKDPHRGRGSSG